jgi:hypothetical protein
MYAYVGLVFAPVALYFAAPGGGDFFTDARTAK